MKLFSRHSILSDLLMQTQPETQPIRIEVRQIEPERNYQAEAEAERLEVLKLEYLAISEAIDMELSDLETEYQNATERRRSTISKRRLTLYRMRVTNTAKIQDIDRRIEENYYKMN